ncbi:phytoene/squalene synthase family protein [Piscinibacter sp. Jin2]|uniref:Phytoene/squalene synthase family protein n=1 Tax=Aquariibacter lacus TaxID=2801332 RepID=A0A9X0XE31_9BURK|nr:phytoene/squalene synthase family protein [Piscinibacter lacus]MBL0719276.1 phytoene/squalene synthase family protein [Piscinibacter lacus]
MSAVLSPSLADDATASVDSAADSADGAACEALMRGGSRSFFAASRLLPQRLRGPAAALYAFCRVADDLIDEASAPPDAVAQLLDRVDRIWAGRPGPVPADRALAEVVAASGLPRTLIEALIEGFAWDAEGRSYTSLPELEAYAARVAGSVGAAMTWLMGRQQPETLARACELGVAMQLTNIARDVGEDARRGRLYLPRQWLVEAGLDPEAWLARPVFGPALAQVIARLLAAADTLYQRAEAGVADLPPDCRLAIRAARLIYAEIGRELERGGLDAVGRRAVVSGPRKLLLIGQALAGRGGRSRLALRSPAPLPAIVFLLEACAARALPQERARPARRRSLAERMVWSLDLCERTTLRRYPQLGASGLPPHLG